ncbi:MAG: GNAT family N-acetyltransferase [Clostridia bacterium]|nr:GNAT family N-acetyltransferase [Clostridia bacterium]
MIVSDISSVYSVRQLNEGDIPSVVALSSGNGLYYRYCPPFASGESVRADMSALPPGRKLEDKHYLGYFKDGRMIAVLDLIEGYPNADTAFIGFFMVEACVQGAGVGSGMIGDLCRALRGCGFSAVRLGWVKGNPQAERFWHRNGFAETGEEYETERYTVVLAERRLGQ